MICQVTNITANHNNILSIGVAYTNQYSPLCTIVSYTHITNDNIERTLQTINPIIWSTVIFIFLLFNKTISPSDVFILHQMKIFVKRYFI